MTLSRTSFTVLLSCMLAITAFLLISLNSPMEIYNPISKIPENITKPLPSVPSGATDFNPKTEASNITIYALPAVDSGVPKKSYYEFTASLPTTSTILLPDKLPRGLLPTNVVGNDPQYLVVIDYSSKGYDTIAQSELTLQLTTTLGDPYPKNVTIGGTFFKIGDWSAFYDPSAPEFEPEYIQLYGHTCGLLNVRVGTMNYQFRAIPDITFDELVQIVNNMKSLH